MMRSDRTGKCDCCKKDSTDLDFVKFPAVDEHQYQTFCLHCRAKFSAWRKRTITIDQLYDRNFTVEVPNDKD